MTQPTVFTPEPAAATEDVVATLVGPDRKYKTVADLATGYINADGFLETLKDENKVLREKAKAAKTIDSVLERLDAVQTSALDKGEAKVSGELAGLTVADVAKIVEQTVTGRETARTKQNNLIKADKLLKEAFGDKAVEVFQKAAPTEALQKAFTILAEVDPEKFASFFVKPSANSGSQVDSSGKNTQAVATLPTGRSADSSCKEYYNNLRKTSPSKYYSQEVQLQMNDAAQKDPDRFFGRK